MAIGDENCGSSHSGSITKCTARQQPTESPKLDTNRGRDKGAKKASRSNPMIGDKEILLGRGKSIRQRPPNTRLLNFVDIFQDHYSVSGPFQRNQIVRWIIEMLQNDGYSFRIRKRPYPASSSTIISDSGCDEDDTDESECENMDDIVLQAHNCWAEASPEQIQKNVAQLFQKPIGSLISAPSVTVTQSRWRQEEQSHHQQQMAVFHHAISSAIDTNSLAATLRNEELQQRQNQVAALNQAISSAIDTSSLAQDLRDCPSPESPLILSASTSSSSFEPVLSLSSDPCSQEQEELELGSFLLPELAVSQPPIEHQSSVTSNEVIQSSEKADSASVTVIHAQKLLQNHYSTLSSVDRVETKESLPKDGVLWSRGTRQIHLLQRMESSIIPVTSFSILPNAGNEAFGEKPKSKVATAGKDENNKSMGHQSKTIGYSEQQVGSVTILRPIILLEE